MKRDRDESAEDTEAPIVKRAHVDATAGTHIPPFACPPFILALLDPLVNEYLCLHTMIPEMLREIDARLHQPIAKHALACTSKRFAALFPRKPCSIQVNNAVIDELAEHFSVPLLAYVNDTYWMRGIGERSVLLLLLACLKHQSREALKYFSVSDNNRYTILLHIDSLRYPGDCSATHSSTYNAVARACFVELGRIGDPTLMHPFIPMLAHSNGHNCLIQGLAETDNLELMLQMRIIPPKSHAPNDLTIQWSISGGFYTVLTHPVRERVSQFVLSRLIAGAATRSLAYIESNNMTTPDDWPNAWISAIESTLSVPMIDLVIPHGELDLPDMFVNRLYYSACLIPDDTDADNEQRLSVFLRLYQLCPNQIAQYLLNHPAKMTLMASWMDIDYVGQIVKIGLHLFPTQMVPFLHALIMDGDATGTFIVAFVDLYYTNTPDRPGFRACIQNVLMNIKRESQMRATVSRLMRWLMPRLDEMPEIVLPAHCMGAFPNGAEALRAMRRGHVVMTAPHDLHCALLSTAMKKGGVHDPDIIQHLEEVCTLTRATPMDQTMARKICNAVEAHLSAFNRSANRTPQNICWFLRVLLWYERLVAGADELVISFAWRKMFRAIGKCPEAMQLLKDTLYVPHADVPYWQYIVLIACAHWNENVTHLPTEHLPVPSDMAIAQWNIIAKRGMGSNHNEHYAIFYHIITQKGAVPCVAHWIRVQRHKSKPFMLDLPLPDRVLDHLLCYGKTRKFKSIREVIKALARDHPEVLENHEDTRAALLFVLFKGVRAEPLRPVIEPNDGADSEPSGADSAL